MITPEKYSWAIRDIKHGKTFFFDSFEEMIEFIEKVKINEVSNSDSTKTEQ